jgi:hypothetical protein
MVWLVVISSFGALAFMALALGITQIFKGRDIRGEVGTNPDMQRLGLKCPAREGCDEPPAGECENCKAVSEGICKGRREH